ncbi:MAG: hypothetical protein H6825_14545 [Planctomycetes bacterium]|nr:hypothetical protein [Planctomycetota bacterium]
MDKDLRRLVVVGVALVVVLFVGRVLLDAFLSDDMAQRNVSKFSSALSTGAASKRPPRSAMDEAVRLRDALETELDEVLPRLAYVQPPEFSVASDASADLRYVEVLRREQGALVNESRFLGKSVPLDLGMPVPNPTGLEDVLAALRAMHVVHLVVTAAVASDVDAVEAIKVPTSRRRGRQESGFLRTAPVEFDLRGTPAAVRRTLGALVDGEIYLALDDVSLESVDEDGERVRCHFSAATVDVDPEAIVLQKGKRG